MGSDEWRGHIAGRAHKAPDMFDMCASDMDTGAYFGFLLQLCLQTVLGMSYFLLFKEAWSVSDLFLTLVFLNPKRWHPTLPLYSLPIF